MDFQFTEPKGRGAIRKVSFGRGFSSPISSVSQPSFVGSPGRGRGLAYSGECYRSSLLVGQSAQGPYTSTPVNHQPSGGDLTDYQECVMDLTNVNHPSERVDTHVYDKPSGGDHPANVHPQSSVTDGAPWIHNQSGERESTFRELGVLITELGKQIGDSVTARLLLEKEGVSNNGRESRCSQASNATVDLSQLSMALTSSTKEIPIFRGESADRCSVHEWIDLMSINLKRRNIGIEDQFDEIMSKLMGRARDVVKIGIRSDPSLRVEQKPDAVYVILKQHFSDLSYSCMPLADFYSTLPRANESPLDYWVRLNRAADVADECLQRQGKGMGDLNGEVAMMFVRHCNEPSLSVVFKSKLSSSWTAKEVQERIDDYHRELKARASRPAAERCTRQAVAAVTVDVQEMERLDPDVMLQSHEQCVSRPSPSRNVSFPPQHRPQPSVEFASLKNSMDKMSEMLGEVLSKVAKGPATGGRHRPSQGGAPGPCRVCGEASHSTTTHCKQHNLCFSCKQPGHGKFQCPNVHGSAPLSTPGAPTSSNQGN